MPKREIYYGADCWRDPKFDVVAARGWLAAVGSDDPNLLSMLKRVSSGGYENINRRFTDFVVELQRNKHSDNDEVMLEFFKTIIADLISLLDLEKITTNGLRFLCENSALIDLPQVAARIKFIITERDNSIISK